MFEKPSPEFAHLLACLEQQLQGYRDRRRSLTRNIVAQTNEELRSGTPYIAEVASSIAAINSAELFTEQLANTLSLQASQQSESAALKRGLLLVATQLKLEDSEKSTLVPIQDLGLLLELIVAAVDKMSLHELA